MSQSALRASAAPAQFSRKSRTLLKDAIVADRQRRAAFYDTIADPEIAHEIENDPDAFADCLEFAIATGLVDQIALARNVGYANSQVGRWAARKAVPPLLVRRGVISELASIDITLQRATKML